MTVARDADRQAARERLRAQDHQRRHSTAANQLMPLAEFYRQRSSLPMLPPGPPRCPAGCSHWWGWAA
jgi:hypothetical protein